MRFEMGVGHSFSCLPVLPFFSNQPSFVYERSDRPCEVASQTGETTQTLPINVWSPVIPAIRDCADAVRVGGAVSGSFPERIP